MFRLSEQLFQGARLSLTAHEPDQDAAVEARWTNDPEYLRLVSNEPARPLSAAAIKKKYEEQEKEKNHRRLSFALRLRGEAAPAPAEGDAQAAPAACPERLIGFVRFENIDWSNGSARLVLGVGAADDRRRGYGTEALGLALRYAFEELNLHRLGAETAAYNQGALRLLEQAGFQVEVRRREALYRDGRRWDDLWLGLLSEEWQARRAEAQA